MYMALLEVKGFYAMSTPCRGQQRNFGPLYNPKIRAPPSFGATAGQNDSTSIIFQSLYNLFGEENPSVELSALICNKNGNKSSDFSGYTMMTDMMLIVHILLIMNQIHSFIHRA